MKISDPEKFRENVKKQFSNMLSNEKYGDYIDYEDID